MLEKFNKFCSQIITEMSNNTTVEARSCWMNKDDQEKFITTLKEKYDIKGKFHDDGEEHSYWTLTGDKENIKKVMSKFSAIFINN